MKKRVNGEGIALLHDLDDCTGCFGCEAACRETWRYPYDEDWMRVIRRTPFVVDGKLRTYHVVAPVLDKCAACYAKDPDPLCVTGCPGQALRIGMTEALGAQPAEVALGFSIYALAAGFASLVVGDVINKIKLRGSMLCSAVLFSGGFLILGLMTEIWQVYVAYVVMGVGSALGGMVILSGIPNNWFNKRRGIATAIIWSAMFPGSLVVGQIIPAATASGNWQMAPFALAGIAFVVLIVGAFLLKWQPQEVGLLPDGMTEEEAAAQAEAAGAAKLVGLTRGEALKTSTFWFIAIAFALIGIGEQGPFQNFPAYIVGNGFDLAVAGAFMSAISLSGVVGKLASGVIIDAVGPRIAYCILNSLAVVGLVLIIFVGDNIVLLFASSILFGVALSSSAVCFSTATAMYLGPKHFGAIYGLCSWASLSATPSACRWSPRYRGRRSASPARSASAPCSLPARPSPCSWCARTRSSSRWRRRPPRSFRRKWRPNSSNAPEFALRARPGAWKKPRLQGG